MPGTNRRHEHLGIPAMRIDITFNDFQTKQTLHQTLGIVQTFVNDGLADRYYGPGMTWIDVSVQSHAKPGRKPKRNRKYKDSFAEHVLYEVNAEFGPADQLCLQDFHAALALIETCVADSSGCWDGEFQLDAFRNDIVDLMRTSPTDDEELGKYAKTAPSLANQIVLKSLRSEELHRFENPRSREKRLAGMRCYAAESLANLVEKYATNYRKLFEGLLRAENWMTPGYSEIYFNLDESDDLARLNRSAIEAWHENAYAVIPPKAFAAANSTVKATMVFDAFCSALRELAEIDHLDLGILDTVITQIKKTGLETDLVYLRQENDTHTAGILYRINKDGGVPGYRLVVTERSTGDVAECELDVQPEEELWLAYRFGKLELTKNEVRIRARKGQRATVSLKRNKRPPLIAFKLDELFRST